MGCDIHIAIEKKIEGKWVMVTRLPWNSPATDRNYQRFAALANVRGEGPNPRGIPKDVSESTRLFINEWGIDGHSHSWMSLEQASKLFLLTEFKTNDFAKQYPASHYFDVDGDIKDYRIVFWFDN